MLRVLVRLILALSLLLWAAHLYLWPARGNACLISYGAHGYFIQLRLFHGSTQIHHAPFVKYNVGTNDNPIGWDIVGARGVPDPRSGFSYESTGAGGLLPLTIVTAPEWAVSLSLAMPWLLWLPWRLLRRRQQRMRGFEVIAPRSP
jgi:hypothetical protein